MVGMSHCIFASVEESIYSSAEGRKLPFVLRTAVKFPGSTNTKIEVASFCRRSSSHSQQPASVNALVCLRPSSPTHPVTCQSEVIYTSIGRGALAILVGKVPLFLALHHCDPMSPVQLCLSPLLSPSLLLATPPIPPRTSSLLFLAPRASFPPLFDILPPYSAPLRLPSSTAPPFASNSLIFAAKLPRCSLQFHACFDVLTPSFD